jgi:hypothetical protein
MTPADLRLDSRLGGTYSTSEGCNLRRSIREPREYEGASVAEANDVPNPFGLNTD